MPNLLHSLSVALREALAEIDRLTEQVSELERRLDHYRDNQVQTKANPLVKPNA
jgi:hypothetical protein